MRKLKITEQEVHELFEQKMAELLAMTAMPKTITMDMNPNTTLLKGNKIEVVFLNNAYKKMQCLISKSAKEIGWHGIVKRVSATRFEIEDIVLFPQVVTASTVTPDAEEYTKWMMKMAEEKPDDLTRMRFHGHSHVNMATSPSGTDTTYQQTVTQNIPDFYIFGIFNKSGSAWFTIYDFENNTLYENADIDYLYIPDEEDDWADAAIKECVKEPPVTPPTHANTYSGYSGYSNYGGYNYSNYYADKEWDNKTKTWVTKKKNNSTYIDDDDDYDDYYRNGYWRRNSGYKGVNYD